MKKVKLPGSRFRITSGIYLITCETTGDTYIGKSKNLNQRWCQHRNKLRNNEHENPVLQKLYNEHGSKMFTMELLELVPEIEQLESREVYWIENKKPSLNVVNTRLSEADVSVILGMVANNVELEQIATKYNLTLKYLKEILRGDRWSHKYN
ncbi:MAG: GIY-YIG nuclease family protein [Candidatus Riesia sp.]|nr:GIY-YIG nuclease family protein [Candidatus Riesia sp.]